MPFTDTHWRAVLHLMLKLAKINSRVAWKRHRDWSPGIAPINSFLSYALRIFDSYHNDTTLFSMKMAMLQCVLTPLFIGYEVEWTFLIIYISFAYDFHNSGTAVVYNKHRSSAALFCCSSWALSFRVSNFGNHFANSISLAIRNHSLVVC